MGARVPRFPLHLVAYCEELHEASKQSKEKEEALHTIKNAYWTSERMSLQQYGRGLTLWSLCTALPAAMRSTNSRVLT